MGFLKALNFLKQGFSIKNTQKNLVLSTKDNGYYANGKPIKNFTELDSSDLVGDWEVL